MSYGTHYACVIGFSWCHDEGSVLSNRRKRRFFYLSKTLRYFRTMEDEMIDYGFEEDSVRASYSDNLFKFLWNCAKKIIIFEKLDCFFFFSLVFTRLWLSMEMTMRRKVRKKARKKARGAENFTSNKVRLALNISRSGQKPSKLNSSNFFFQKCVIINTATSIPIWSLCYNEIS